MRLYYIQNGQEQEGPYNKEDLAGKQIYADTPVWFEGLQEWSTIGQIEELKALVDHKSPPPFVKSESPDNFIEREYSTKKRKKVRKSIVFITLIVIFLSIGFGAYYAYLEQEKSHFRFNSTFYVTAQHDGFKYNKILGGISDLKISVANNSNYVLENVRIVVTYLRKNGNVFKEELVDVSYLLPHSQTTISAPDSDAGMDVSCKIYSIKCTEAGLY